ncbi:hypothetical protein [Serratia marcescens]|uniref:hypothetical protein n=1 Tax=Serratia marcescens TaxID=615 RepID=UPI0034E8730C
MTNLSELSKPVAWEVKGILCHSEEEARIYVGEPEPLYSQEYVSALDKVAQFWIGESAGWKKRAEEAEKRIAELEAKLANREAQPVLYASEETLAYAKEGEKSLVTWSEPMGDAVIPLYTSPPAPAVPDDYLHLKNVQELYHSQEERLFALAQRIKGVSFDKYSHTTAQAIDVLEREIFGDDGGACRAAMLAQPVSSGYKLPPHVYRDLVNSLRDTAVQFSGTEQLRERLNTTLHQFIEPDHPHTRTVAPEGGSGSSST